MCCGRGFPAWIVVFVTAVLIPITCVITYFWARSLDHVEWTFPYISDGGQFNPEACVFSLLFALVAFGTFLSVCIRWSVVNEHYESSRRIQVINHTALPFGMIGALGILIVSTFRVGCIPYAHYIGAILAFGLGCVYMILQAVISLCRPTRTLYGYMKCMGYLRLIIATIASIFAIVSGSIGMYLKITTVELPGGKWDSSIDGFDLHLVSTSTEWATAGLVAFYFMTFLAEFKAIKIGMPALYISKQNNIAPMIENHQ